MPNVLSLFSGIAGLDQGVRLAVPTARTVCYVEGEAPVIAILAARMASGEVDAAPIWPDVRTFSGVDWAGVVDLITAGFNCQPWSLAGKRGGTSDDRWLWDDISRIINEVRPPLVFLENVPGLAHGGLESICSSLAEAGYDAEWGCFSKAKMGAVDKRERLFFLAYRRCLGLDRLQSKRLPGGLPETMPRSCGQVVANVQSPGFSGEQTSRLPLRGIQPGRDPDGLHSTVGDSLCPGLAGWAEQELLGQCPAPKRAGHRFWPPDRNIDNWVGVPAALWPAVERDVRGVATGVAISLDKSLKWFYAQEDMSPMPATSYWEGLEEVQILQPEVLCSQSGTIQSLKVDSAEESPEKGKGSELQQMWDYFQKTGTAPPGLQQTSGSSDSLHDLSPSSRPGAGNPAYIQKKTAIARGEEGLSDLQNYLLRRASYARYTLWFLAMSERVGEIMQSVKKTEAQRDSLLRMLWGRVYPNEVSSNNLLQEVRKSACLGTSESQIGRVDRLRALGNSANPLQSAVAFGVLQARAGLHLCG